ncbi:hypothetical protein NE237_018491 [Protea cynaroides]|uniref:Uncharacterized protein n=1 Tax=Protea cynaroides TaxID=273540 RepID=A0A9Q0QP18_9MAGN|nr:hypothetical protein NE237_018491 [Protea cynaroides]
MVFNHWRSALWLPRSANVGGELDCTKGGWWYLVDERLLEVQSFVGRLLIEGHSTTTVFTAGGLSPVGNQDTAAAKVSQPLQRDKIAWLGGVNLMNKMVSLLSHMGFQVVVKRFVDSGGAGQSLTAALVALLGCSWEDLQSEHLDRGLAVGSKTILVERRPLQVAAVRGDLWLEKNYRLDIGRSSGVANKETNLTGSGSFRDKARFSIYGGICDGEAIYVEVGQRDIYMGAHAWAPGFGPPETSGDREEVQALVSGVVGATVDNEQHGKGSHGRDVVGASGVDATCGAKGDAKSRVSTELPGPELRPLLLPKSG